MEKIVIKGMGRTPFIMTESSNSELIVNVKDRQDALKFATALYSRFAEKIPLSNPPKEGGMYWVHAGESCQLALYYPSTGIWETGGEFAVNYTHYTPILKPQI